MKEFTIQVKSHVHAHHSWGGGASHIGESVSEDWSAGNGTGTAVSTAKIFRGLTIRRDGTVTSRKIKGSSGSQGKADEKSRQTAKIDKAIDLVEQSVNVSNKELLF